MVKLYCFAVVAAKYRNDDLPNGKKSGFHECWKHLVHFTDDDFKNDLSLNLWGGSAGARSIVGDVLQNDKYFISQLTSADFASSKWIAPSTTTLDSTQRRLIQISKSRKSDYSPYLDIDGFKIGV